MHFPEEMKYTKDHEWVLVDGDTVTVGITDFAQSELGDIVYVEVESEGEELNAGDVFGTIEAVKTVSDLFMPVSGQIISFNDQLESQPEDINSAPYEKGWIIKIHMSDPNQLNELMDAKAYGEMVS